MIQVTFESVGPGRCGWCKKEKEAVYAVSFSDKSFVGPMCKSDLLRAVEMKCPLVPGTQLGKPTVPPQLAVTK